MSKYCDIIRSHDRELVSLVSTLSKVDKDTVANVVHDLRLALIMKCIENNGSFTIPYIGTIKLNMTEGNNRVKNVDFYMHPQMRKDFSRIWNNQESLIGNEVLNELREAITDVVEKE